MKVITKKFSALSFSFLFLFSWVAWGDSPAKKPMIFEVETENRKSQFTEALIEALKVWPKPREFCKAEDGPFQTHTVGIRNPERDYSIGFKKCMIIDAPVAKAAAVIDDFANYQKLFPGFKTVIQMSQTQEETVLEWEKEIPFFLASNIKYQMAYFSNEPQSGRKFYRYQFRKGDRLKYSDGIEVFETLPNGKTLFTNYEFYDADYGIGLFGINAVSAQTVWKESLEGSYRSILSIRFKAEHPQWSYEKVKSEAEVILKKIDLAKVEYLENWNETFYKLPPKD